jgi:putative transposase
MHDWPHAPIHRLAEAGAYMVTAGTYLKKPHFYSTERLDFLCDSLLGLAQRYGWQLQAWAIFSNHYHFVAVSPLDPSTLKPFIRHLHSISAKEINRVDGTRGRKVWFEYWETQLTYQKSYLARLNYVHRNAVHHALVRAPSSYCWCSAGWFERRADPAFFKTVMNYPSDRINVPDEFIVPAILHKPE